MYKPHGVILISVFGGAILLPTLGLAISIGDLTFSLLSNEDVVTKRVVNNNKTARFYNVSVTSIKNPRQVQNEVPLMDGELLYSPKHLTLQAGESEYFKFYYKGPKDNKERYYRVSFKEIPTQNRVVHRGGYSSVSMEPVVVVDAILVIRPRDVNFDWSFDKKTGTVTNKGNTWFKLVSKLCDSMEEDGAAWYLQPRDMVRHSFLRQESDNYIIYNDTFINISKNCTNKR